MTITGAVTKKTVLIIERDKRRADQYFQNLAAQSHGVAYTRIDAQGTQAGLTKLKAHRVDLVVCAGSVMTPENARAHLGKAPFE